MVRTFAPRLLGIAALLLGSAAALAQVAPPPAPAPAVQPGQAAPQDQQGGLVVDVVGGVSAPQTIAVPPFPTNQSVNTPAGSTEEVGQKLAGIVKNDLQNSGLFRPAQSVRAIAFGEVQQPQFEYWAGAGSQALVQGFVRANGDGSLSVGCYLYDTFSRTELTRGGWQFSPNEWRRAGHKCADLVYSKLTGEGPYFDSRIIYVSETGPKGKRIKRLAIMDQDGENHRFLTNGQSIVLTPRFAPNQQTIAYMSYINNKPAIYIYDVGSGRQRLLVQNVNISFAPRFSPDSRYVLFSMAVNGNTDIYRIPAGGGSPQRLTNSPAIDTGGSYSPDGSRIVFESDRSGTQQIYVMNADGSNPQRISFGGGRYATPVWSPRGDLIAFTKIGGGFRIGVMSPSGGGERLLTDSWHDEGPSWSPNGRVVTFYRATQGGSGKADVWQVDLTGKVENRIRTPLDGSDPAWGPLRP
ncbi:Tol-Pal system beta propeller repeat protein TolB [Sphingomonas aracearum]|uniref:Tol-Pal system protein TolB n=1 Tax=Sphingomonas aracearum TaxID=2283317 RepID=A0A369VSF8_9SPHN|nr:Tol-Pal system beta propeller repeat protein TolB [Sphingomonas aracearum]RDE04605.1 Tol-Pal system protein TolB [Sphingomonas aracearum]